VRHYALNTRRACRLIKQTRSVQYHRSVKDPRHDLRARVHEIARTRVPYGYRRIHVPLKRDGWQLGKNKMYRLISGRTATTALEVAEAAQNGGSTPRANPATYLERGVEFGLRIRSAR
jgi:transposase InsO family protein